MFACRAKILTNIALDITSFIYNLAIFINSDKFTAVGSSRYRQHYACLCQCQWLASRLAAWLIVNDNR